MASIRREIVIEARPSDVWDAIRDVGAVHTRLAPGFVVDTKMEEGARIVTFGSGLIARELIVDIDEDARRLVWAVVGGRLKHHNASLQVFAHGDAASRVIWIADLLPDSDPQKEVLVKYAKDYTEFTDGEPISTFGGHGWDAMMWAIEGLESLKDGMSLADRRAGVRDYIEGNIKNWPGTGGVFNITPDDHLGLSYDDLAFVKVVGGTWSYFPQEDW